MIEVNDVLASTSEEPHFINFFQAQGWTRFCQEKYCYKCYVEFVLSLTLPYVIKLGIWNHKFLLRKLNCLWFFLACSPWKQFLSYLQKIFVCFFSSFFYITNWDNFIVFLNCLRRGKTHKIINLDNWLEHHKASFILSSGFVALQRLVWSGHF